MDEEIERLIVSVRADTGAFARDVADMRGQLEGPLADGAARAGRLVEDALLKAVRTGKLGFEDLKRIALAAMTEIARAAVREGIGAIGADQSGGGGLLSLVGALVPAILGTPGRATGGGVAPGRAYLVGERGPELFVPIASGRIDSMAGARPRDVRLNITINTPVGEAPRALARSSRQVARAVKQALMRVED
jgi:hypothetical protein